MKTTPRHEGARNLRQAQADRLRVATMHKASAREHRRAYLPGRRAKALVGRSAAVTIVQTTCTPQDKVPGTGRRARTVRSGLLTSCPCLLTLVQRYPMVHLSSSPSKVGRGHYGRRRCAGGACVVRSLKYKCSAWQTRSSGTQCGR